MRLTSANIQPATSVPERQEFLLPKTLGQQAEEYAKTGWSIFPLRPRDKTPLTAHGLKDATTNIDTVRRWWAQAPQANIGLNCGKSGLVVIDLDKRGENDGMAEWASLTRGLDIKTSVSLTGGGGQHLLFKSPDGLQIKNSAGRLAPAIDVRGEGGYIVLPPSIHPSGKPYAWQDSTTTIEQLPPQVIDILIHEPDPWQVFTLRDAFAPREPLTWLVEGLVYAGSLSIWYGAPGTLKSMILSDLAVSVASGSHWLSKPGDPLTGTVTNPGAVMWLDFDNGQRRTHERFAALARARNLPDSTPLYYVSMASPILATGDAESIRSLAARVIDRDVRLVIIDNLLAVSGGMDENSADMQMPMAGLRWLAETGAAVIVIHHQRKTQSGKARTGETLRGHGSIEAALDSAILITRDDQTVIVTATKVRGVSIKPFSAKFTFDNDAQHELKTARFWPIDLKAEAAADAEEEENELEENIISELAKFGAMSANQAYDRVGGNRTNVLFTIREMVKEGKIGQKQGARGFLIYAHEKP